MLEAKWIPSADVVAAANLTAAINERGFASYDEFYEWSRTTRADFWGYTVHRLGIRMQRPPRVVLGTGGTAEQPDWFPEARLNIAESCFQQHPARRAVVYRREGALHEMTYGELRTAANRVAASLAGLGMGPGDRVAIAMPMTIESVIAYLGIVLAGAVVVSIADSFAAGEIATRLRIAGARWIVTQDVVRRAGKTLSLYEKIIAAGAEHAIVVDTGAATERRPGDVDWETLLVGEGEFTAVARRPQDHSNILFSSGTTGDPKAIPWTHIAPIKAASDAHYHHDVHPTDIVAWPTNLGWMMGPWLIYASFINGATMALYDDVPTESGFIRFVEEAGVTVLGLVPSLVAAWRAGAVTEGCDWSHIRLFSSTGEASNSADMTYLMDLAGNKPIIDYIGGTELAGGYLAGTVLQPCVPATFTTPTLGGGIHILDDNGEPAGSGEVFIEPPVLGLSQELLNRDHHDEYYAGTPDIGVAVRRHGDYVEKLANGYYRAHGRVDDTMNLGGIKTSSAEIERSVGGIAGLHEVAAVAVEPPGGGPGKLVMYVVVAAGTDLAELHAEMQHRVRSQLNPLFKIADVVAVPELPRTASAKVKRRELRAQYQLR